MPGHILLPRHLIYGMDLGVLSAKGKVIAPGYKIPSTLSTHHTRSSAMTTFIIL